MEKKVTAILACIVILGFSQICSAQSFLQDEAGISAFCKLTTVNLTQAATAYKTIEYQTSEYIIGSVAIPNYPESDDVHVYLNVSGDIIAYYLNQEEVSKIIDWQAYHASGGVLSGSKLETALSIVSNAMFTVPTNVKYHDFRYPNANNIKYVLEDAPKTVTETFRMLIPGSYSVYNRSFSHATRASGSTSSSGNLKLNDLTLSSLSGVGGAGNWNINEGGISASNLWPDIYHTISLYNNTYGHGYAAIVLLYTEP